MANPPATSNAPGCSAHNNTAFVRHIDENSAGHADELALQNLEFERSCHQAGIAQVAAEGRGGGGAVRVEVNGDVEASEFDLGSGRNLREGR